MKSQGHGFTLNTTSKISCVIAARIKISWMKRMRNGERKEESEQANARLMVMVTSLFSWDDPKRGSERGEACATKMPVEEAGPCYLVMRTRRLLGSLPFIQGTMVDGNHRFVPHAIQPGQGFPGGNKMLD